MKKYALVCLSLLALAGCASAPQTVDVPTYVHVCPTMPQYTRDFDRQAADQLATIPIDSPVAKMIDDYGTVRQEIRTCSAK